MMKYGVTIAISVKILALNLINSQREIVLQFFEFLSVNLPKFLQFITSGGTKNVNKRKVGFVEAVLFGVLKIMSFSVVKKFSEKQAPT